ncbi:MAG TPA: SDR family NAD(P)-dependent oxidoreductase [Chloroflexota bacterium]|nr:SDR family NAD(P)-dependent oxidoreductase [Chloroflexota bacterium]
MSESRGVAFVTGATSGIGEGFARELAARGYDLVLHGRRREKLEQLAEELAGKHRCAIEVLIAELADDEGMRLVEDRLRREDRLTMLVNNAGGTPLEPFIETDWDTIAEMIQVHVVALTRFTRAALPGMVARGKGDIINVSSDGIFVTYPSPVMAVYAATKAYVNKLTQALHSQAGDRGVRVQALCPGFVRSDILARFGITFADWGIPDDVVMDAEDQAACSLAALELGEIICVPTLDDATLLDRLAEIGEVIRARSSGSGAPAARYNLREGEV